MKEQFYIDINHPVLKNHKVHNKELLPGLAYIDMLYQVYRERGYNHNELELCNLSIYNPLVVGKDYDILLSIEGTERKEGQWSITIEGQERHNGVLSSEKKRYISAEMRHVNPITFEDTIEINRLKQLAENVVDIDKVYESNKTQGLVHTGFAKAEGSIYASGEDIIIDISLGQEALQSEEYIMFHPVLIDGSAISSSISLSTIVEEEQKLFLPLFYERFRASDLIQKNCIARLHTSSIRQKNELVYITLEFFNYKGRKIAELKNIANKLVRKTALLDLGELGVKQWKKEVQRKDSKSASQETIFAGSVIENSRTSNGIEHILKQLMADCLKKPINQIDINSGYYEMGLDSAGLLEIVHYIESKINTVLPPTLLFEYTTIAELSAFLTENYIEKFEFETSNGIVDQFMEYKEYEDKRDKQATSCTVPLPSTIGDIAVVGIAGQYPKAGNIQEFWSNLKEGKDCISEIPKSRWDWHEFENIKSHTGKDISKWGGFIDDPDFFDPQFFRISPREAGIIDPQERLFLKTCWEAIEDAGYTPKTLVEPKGPNKRHDVGVFVGVMHKDYTLLGVEAMLKGQVVPLSLNYAPIANRVSYFCDFHGPSMVVDTVCSSSLTSVNLALESIQHGECEVALAGGVNLSLYPHKYITYGMAEMHSSDGYCHSFGKDGDGYVSGDGVGVVLLKQLHKAIEDKDHIYAVIKGSAINHCGKVSGFTVPSPVAQEEVIHKCLEKTGVNPRTISYIEAHGTGTSLGDPVEIQGLVKAFSYYTNDRQFCSIGSVKSNIGHAESAAGISGLSKVILQLYHKTLVPSLHSEELNSYIDFKNSPFYVQHQTEEWKQPIINDGRKEIRYPRRAGISSFGATGSNAHIILEEYIPEGIEIKPVTPPDQRIKQVVIPLSAKNKDRLQVYASKLLLFLKNQLRKGVIEGDSLTDKRILYKRIEHKVRINLSDIVHVDVGLIEVGQEWNAIGVEPIHIIQLVERIEDDLQIEVDKQELMQLGCVAAFAKYIADHFGEYLEGELPGTGNTGVLTYAENEKKMQSNELNLSDLAYTLQVGREAMEERVAFVAEDLAGLITRIEAFVDGIKLAGAYWSGNLKGNKEDIDNSCKGQDLLEFNGGLITLESAERIAELWVKGKIDNWSKLYGNDKPCRISLPTYPFSKEHYWISTTESKTNTKTTRNENSDNDQSIRQCNISQPSEQQIKLNISEQTSLDYEQKLFSKPQRVLSPLSVPKPLTDKILDKPSQIPLRNLVDGQNLVAKKERSEVSLIELPQKNVLVDYTTTSGNSLTIVNKQRVLAYELQEELIKSLADALGMDSGDIDADKQFIEMGMDSIIGVEWINSINKKFGTKFAATVVYDYPNIREFARLLEDELNNKCGIDLVNIITTDKPQSPLEAPSQNPQKINIHPPIIKDIRMNKETGTESGKEQLQPLLSVGVLQEELTMSLADALGMDSNEIDADKQFIEMGMDSIIGVEWINSINKKFGTKLVATIVYDYPNIREFTRLLEGELNNKNKDSEQLKIKSEIGNTLFEVLQQVYQGTIEIGQAEQEINKLNLREE